MNEAYNLDKSELQAWLLNGLTHANTALGLEILRHEDWQVETEFDSQEQNLNTYYVALSDVELHVATTRNGDGAPIVFRKGTRVRIITSGKWSEKIMGEMCSDAGFHVQQRWKDESSVYCLYHLASIRE